MNSLYCLRQFMNIIKLWLHVKGLNCYYKPDGGANKMEGGANNSTLRQRRFDRVKRSLIKIISCAPYYSVWEILRTLLYLLSLCHNKGLCVLLSNSTAISTTLPLTISCNKMRILMLYTFALGAIL